MSVVIIINPISGGAGAGAGQARARLAAAVADPLVDDVDIQVTDRPGRARELAQAAVKRGVGRVVAWGGDGTVNEIASALAFGAVPLGLVPAGSGNGLARALRVPADPVRALTAALLVKPRSIDMGELDGHLFVNLAGIGLDAEVAARFNARAQGRRGLLPYLALGLQAILTEAGRAYRIRIDGTERHHRALLIICANGRQYGGGASVAPAAQVDDGALDLVIVEDRPPLARLWAARRLFTGSLTAAHGVHVIRVRAFEVAADGPLRFHVDGEPGLGGASLAGRVHPGALRVRVPVAT